MSETEHGEKPKKRPRKSLFAGWGFRLLRQIERHFEEQRTKREEETPETKAARRTANATRVIAFFTVVLAIIGFLQYQEVQDSSDTLDRMNRIYREQAAQLNRQASETRELVEQMKRQADRTGELAGATKQMASDNGDLLRDTQGVRMDFQFEINPRDQTIYVAGRNRSKINSKWAKDDLLITVRDWKSKKAIMAPILHTWSDGPIRPADQGPLFIDNYHIPNLNKQTIEDLISGKDYLTVEWRASYEDGFRGINYFPPKAKRSCIAAANFQFSCNDNEPQTHH